MIRTILGTALAAALVFVCGANGQGPRANKPVQIEALNTPMPDLNQLKTWINGPAVTAKEARGKVVVVYFWTVNQRVSENNWKHVESWAKQYKDKDVLIVPIHKYQYDGKPLTDEDIIAGVKKKKLASAVDLEDTIGELWKCQYTPTLYLVDRGGKIRYRWQGPMDDNRNLHMEAPLRAKIEELREEKAPAPPR